MAGTFVDIVSGVLTQVAAIASSSGGSDANKIIKLNGSGKLDNSFLPTGVGAETKLIECSEDLSAGDFINVYDDSGEMCRKADATTAGKEAVGFVLSAYTTGQDATVYFEGINDELTGLTPGARQFLSTTAGASTATAPSTSANVVQQIGRAISATEISFEPQQAVTLA